MDPADAMPSLALLAKPATPDASFGRKPPRPLPTPLSSPTAPPCCAPCTGWLTMPETAEAAASLSAAPPSLKPCDAVRALCCAASCRRYS